MELKTTAFIFETGLETEGVWDFERNIFIDQTGNEYQREEVFTLLDKDCLGFKSIESLMKEWNKYSPAVSLKDYLNARKRMLSFGDTNKHITCPHCGKRRQIWPFNNIGPMSGRGGLYWICMSCGKIEDNCFLRA